jgi:hypothetical protein
VPLVADLQPPVAHQPRQRPLHHVTVAAQPLAGLHATPGDPGRAPTPAQRLPTSTIRSSSIESWVLAADRPTARGMPRRSVSRWYLDPDLPRSVGFGPMSSPPVWRAR